MTSRLERMAGMRTLRLLPMLVLMALLFMTCKNDTTEPVAGEGAVSGLVTDGLGGAVAGATISSLGPVASGQSVQTDAQGRFLLKFTLDSSSTLTLAVGHSGFRDTTITVRVLSGSTTSAAIQLASTLPVGPAGVSGTVKDATTGLPVAGATVKGSSPQLDPLTAQSDAAGRFTMTFPVDSTYRQSQAGISLSASRSGYRDTTVAATITFGMSTPVTVRLMPKSAALLSGRVLNLRNGSPVSGASVRVQIVSGGSATQTAVSNILGEYSVAFTLDSTAIANVAVSQAGFRDTTFYTRLTQSSSTTADVSLDPRSTIAGLSGTVTDALAGIPLSSASVTAQVISPSQQAAQTAVTNIVGEFNFLMTVDTTSIVRLAVNRTGYRDTTLFAKAIPGTMSAIVVGMRQGIAGNGGTGLPQTIAFLGATPPELSVNGVGGKETAVLDWEVRDSLGNPVDANHTALLTFSIVGGPGGGEYLSPTAITTTASGKASVTFNSGIRSGVAQVVASTSVGNRIITSSPIRVVIDGGFPDQRHFTVASPFFNLPALGVAAYRQQISVLAGDKYSNPAAASAVYFRTSACVVQGTFGSAVTTKDGQGTVDLITGNPYPFGSASAAAWGDGYFFVAARTIGEAGTMVQDSVLFLLSGEASITSIAPSSFNIPNGGSQSIAFHVEDALGHPLAQGNTITVTASIPPPPVDGQLQNKVFLQFGKDGTVVLPDLMTPGPGSTQFSLTLSDGSWGIVDSVGTPVIVTISVIGPNAVGGISTSVMGTVH